MDERLEPYLSASEPQEPVRLDELMRDHARPVIRRAVRAKLEGAWDDIEDVCSEAQLELLIHLRRIKAQPAEGIRDFPAYVMRVASNACSQYFRRRRPGWDRLRRQVLYLFQHEAQFRVSHRSDRRTWCELEEWDLDRAPANPQHLELARLEGDRDLSVLIRRVLEAAAGGVELNRLVGIVARTWHIAPDSLASPGLDLETVAAPGEPIEVGIHRRTYAARLWQEVQHLPRPQRVALLLSLRDGRGSPALSLFPLTGVASFREVASALEISAVELAAFWNDLPYSDRKIGELLGCAQQQVINLRMAARKRLKNRLKDER